MTTRSPGGGTAFDRLCAVAGLIVLAPLCAVAACAILIEDGRPVFYRQRRIGRYGRPFSICKFRSMRVGAPGAAVTADGDARLLRVGRVLRKYKIDEVPQLWNVLKGEMRLVGPRPEVPGFVDQTMALWRELLAVPPGLTDPATLVYRHEESLLANRAEPERFYRETILPAKLALSLRYLRQRSFWRDVKVLLMTTRYAALPSAAVDPSRIFAPLGLAVPASDTGPRSQESAR